MDVAEKYGEGKRRKRGRREVWRGKEEEERVRGGRGEEEKYGEGKRRKRG